MKNDELVLSQSHTSGVKIITKRQLFLGFKRCFDILASIIGLIPFLLLIIIVKILYMITGDFHRIIFSQERIGRNGNLFKFYKFRTMIPNADEALQKILKENKEMAKEYEKNKKLKNDPRITKVGKFLRKTSLDEVPQLINVFKGEMSLIGNRPYLPREKDDMGKYYDDIVKTKPGITGYWQTHGRNNLTFKERLKLESYYSKNVTLKMDIKIFFMTFVKVIKKEGV